MRLPERRVPNGFDIVEIPAGDSRGSATITVTTGTWTAPVYVVLESACINTRTLRCTDYLGGFWGLGFIELLPNA